MFKRSDKCTFCYFCMSMYAPQLLCDFRQA